MLLESLQTFVAFVVTISILVSFHEYGHFWMARRCGVKVLVFSLGFGKKLWSFTDRHGTEFVLSMIPLGGYVKMFGEKDEEITEAEKQYSLNHKSVWARMAIVLAGPIANFLLAIVVLSVTYIVGIKSIVPVIGGVVPGSLVDIAGFNKGNQIVSVDGTPIQNWQQLNLSLLKYMGESRDVAIQIKQNFSSMNDSKLSQRVVPIRNWLVGDKEPNPINALGIVPYKPVVEPVLGELLKGGAALEGNLQSGDRIVSVNNEKISDWNEFVNVIRKNANQKLIVMYQREEKIQKTQITPKLKVLNMESYGFIGAGVQVQEVNWPDSMIHVMQYNVFESFYKGTIKTWDFTALTVSSLYNILKGLISINHLSGPITIAKVANQTLQIGFESFMYFLAMLSVSLGVFNLLPVPMLDGGHFLFYCIEAVRGKPLSSKTMSIGMTIGFALVVSLMAIAMYNDIDRFF